MKKLLALATSVLLGLGLAVVGSSAAYAGGSDSPTPYTVTVDGIQLPDGVSFRDNGHVNIKTNLGNAGIHFESRNWPADHPKTFYIGKNFLPWDAFGFDKTKLCVSWVQIDFYAEHFGEGGQAPVGMGCEQPPVDQCEAKWQNNDPEQDCFNGPEKPKPLSGEETRTGDPVCVIPVVVETMTVDSESCVPEEPQKPKPPVQTPPRDELATTGVDSIFWLYSGGALLVGAGVLALMLGLAARKRRVE